MDWFLYGNGLRHERVNEWSDTWFLYYIDIHKITSLKSSEWD